MIGKMLNLRIIPNNIFMFTHSKDDLKISYDKINETKIINQIIFENLVATDFQCVKSILEIVDKRDECFKVCVMGSSIDLNTLSLLLNWQSNNEEKDIDKMLIFSIDIASKFLLNDNTYVGAYSKMDETVPFVCAINEENLQYKKFKYTIPAAKNVSEYINSICNSNLEKIILLDLWCQKNIQYIKNRVSICGGKEYIVDSVDRQSIMPDVLLNHYGTCEDISSSISMVLTFLNIEHYMVNDLNIGHAWILAKLEGKYYIWDATHNITRGTFRLENELRVSNYDCKFTLIGYETVPSKYYSFEKFINPVSISEYSREKIKAALTNLPFWDEISTTI